MSWTNICSSKFIAFGFVPALLSAAVLLYRADPFDPAPFPAHEFTHHHFPTAPSLVNARMLEHSDYIGSGHLLGPEDLAYDPRTRVIYTGCADGWIKRVTLDDSLTENWVNTGGRPLGIAISGTQLIVADAYKGLLRISSKDKMEVLTYEAEGLKFKLTDGVDVAKDGTIYFTDASHKYEFHEYLTDLLESRPHGRLLSFNPYTSETKVLLRNLYFPNGVAISPNQTSLIFCETPLFCVHSHCDQIVAIGHSDQQVEKCRKRCRRYWLRGSKKGSVEAFTDNLPGYPDNIHCDNQNNYWIAISSSVSPYLERAYTIELIRKVIVIIERYISLLKHVQGNGGIYGVDLQGKPTAHIYDPAVSLISSAIKIEDTIYVGSLRYPHIISYNSSRL